MSREKGLASSSALRLSNNFTVPFSAAAPPFGRRLICCVIDIEELSVSAVITGNTYPFRAQLDAANIGGDYGPADSDGHREYYRVLPSQAMDTFDLAGTLATLFCGSIVLCSLRAEPPADSPGAAYVDGLKDQPNLSFLASNS